MDRKRKKEITQVIKKYTGTSSGRILAQDIAISTTPAGAIIAADYMITGGISTLVISVLTMCGLMDASKLVEKSLKIEAHENTFGQRYIAKPLVVRTMRVMEMRLQDAFNTASASHAPPDAKENFRRVAQDITRDAQTLSPVVKVVAGGDHFEFALRLPDGFCKATLNMSQALDHINEKEPQAPEKTRQQIIDELRTRIEAFETPHTETLDKKKPRPKS